LCELEFPLYTCVTFRRQTRQDRNLDNARIAVLMPVYNEERNLPVSLRSVAEQSIRPSCVLIGDNCSTDGGMDLARALLQQSQLEYDIVRVNRRPELGILNVTAVIWALDAILERRAPLFDYVAILGADTVLEPRYFEKLVALFESDPKLSIAGGRCYPLGILSSDYVLPQPVEVPWGSNKVYRAETWFQLSRMADVRTLPDWDMDHSLLALVSGGHLRVALHAHSWALRLAYPRKGKMKGWQDAEHGLPFWWCVARSLRKGDLRYLQWYVVTRLSSRRPRDPHLSDLRRLYAHSALTGVARIFAGET
jgi:glycosyltransferase involved in cell wall biosynthesis